MIGLKLQTHKLVYDMQVRRRIANTVCSRHWQLPFLPHTISGIISRASENRLTIHKPQQRLPSTQTPDPTQVSDLTPTLPSSSAHAALCILHMRSYRSAQRRSQQNVTFLLHRRSCQYPCPQMARISERYVKYPGPLFAHAVWKCACVCFAFLACMRDPTFLCLSLSICRRGGLKLVSMVCEGVWIVSSL